MKKILLVLTLVFIFSVVSVSAVFASGKISLEEKNAIKSMFESMENWLKDAEKNGEVTKDEAREWKDHFRTMEKYHKENGFGHCGGNGESQNMPSEGSGMMSTNL